MTYKGLQKLLEEIEKLKETDYVTGTAKPYYLTSPVMFKTMIEMKIINKKGEFI